MSLLRNVRLLSGNSLVRPSTLQTMRFFASDAETLRKFKTSQVSRISVRDDRANQLIAAVDHKDYNLARILVKERGIHVDGHEKNENTALTAAAKNGDVEGVRFLLRDLGANPNASCHCPMHRTALHYASEYGHKKVVKVLLEHGANPNVLNMHGQTALDVVRRNEDVKQLLIEAGGKTKEQLMMEPVTYQRRLPQ